MRRCLSSFSKSNACINYKVTVLFNKFVFKCKRDASLHTEIYSIVVWSESLIWFKRVGRLEQCVRSLHLCSLFQRVSIYIIYGVLGIDYQLIIHYLFNNVHSNGTFFPMLLETLSCILLCWICLLYLFILNLFIMTIFLLLLQVNVKKKEFNIWLVDSTV